MREISRRTVCVEYSQVGLHDVESGPDPSRWESDDELATSGTGGIAVAAPGDEMIDVVVVEGPGRPAT